MASSAILPLHSTWTGCDNRNCGDQSRCFHCDGCRNWKAEKALERLKGDIPVSTDELIRVIALKVKSDISDVRLQISEVRRLGVKLLGDLETLNKA